MALFCVVWMLYLHRPMQSNWICPLRILSFYGECRLKKQFHVHFKQISCSKVKCSPNDPKSNKNTPFHEVGSKNDDHSDGDLEEPTTCCMSGCANCVWIQYAEELSKRYKDGGEKAKEAIMKMADPNMKAFLLTEVRSLKKD